MQSFTLGSSKIKVSKTDFFDTVSAYNDHSSCVKHVLGGVYVFFTLFGLWVRGMSPKGLVHNLRQLFRRGSSKIKIAETCFLIS